MRYWVFVNNSVEGPLTIKEIIEKNYISPDLLVCPSEMTATKPSSWYFAKELSEFDPYIETKRNIKVAVEDINLQDFSYEKDSLKIKEYEPEVNDFYEILNREREKLEEREKEEYRKKIFSFERNIKELDEKLKKALSSIENYEKVLKEKDVVIEKLEKEIDELKKLREEDRKNFEEKIKKYEELLSTKREEHEISIKNEHISDNAYELSPENEDIKKLNELGLVFNEKSLAEKGLDNSDGILEYELPQEIGVEKDNLIQEEKLVNKIDLDGKRSFLEDKDKDTFVENNLSDVKTDVIDNPKDEDEVINSFKDNIEKDTPVSEVKEEDFSPLPEIDLLSLSKKVIEKDELKQEDKIVLREEVFFESHRKDNVESSNLENEYKVELDSSKDIVYKKFEPVEIKNTDFISQENILDKFEVSVSSFSSVKPIEKDVPFQVADINLEKVETKLDVIPSSKIEPVISNENILVEDKLDQKKGSNSDISYELEKNAFVEPKDEVKTASLDLKKENNNQDATTKSFIKEIESIELDKKEEINLSEVEEKREKQEKLATSSQKISISVKKNKATKLIILASFSIIIFFFALIYILRTGRDVDITKNQAKGAYSQPLKQNDNQISVKSEDNSLNNQDKQEEDLKIAKINQNVQKAIDIVKNYNLGDGKGNIERWLSNSVTSVNGKEEWNATYLSGNLFVVQYRFLRFKAEPIVYLFEVDVEKNDIVRGINNNAINLLAGSKKEKKLDKALSKKFDKHIEKDDEMF